MANYGSWNIDDFLTFAVNTHNPTTGVATDADVAPPYRVYEDETATPILTGTMALLDSANTAGFYSEQIQLTATDGFEKGKSYNIYVSATVGGTEGTISHDFQIKAAADTVEISGSIVAADNLQRGAEALVLGAAIGTPTTTVIGTDLTETTTDHYLARIVTFTTGNIAGQASDITGYNGATKELTVSALTDAPAATDVFVIS